jgi:hypothetical protein
MSDCVEHCPFLNRSDARCAENFNIDHLQHAFKFCFGRYKACTTYVELLVERRIRRSEAAERMHAAPEAMTTTAAAGNHGNDERLIQVTVSARHAQHVARAA